MGRRSVTQGDLMRVIVEIPDQAVRGAAIPRWYRHFAKVISGDSA